MPFKSEKQRKYLYSQKPEVAKRFAAEEKKKAIKRRMNRRQSNNGLSKNSDFYR